MSAEASTLPAAQSAYLALKPAMRKFVDGYLSGEKGSVVMRGIRPHLKKPEVLASKWLARPDVKAAIAERRANMLEAAGVHQEMIVRELARIAFGDPRKLFDEHGKLIDLHKLDEETAAMVSGFEVEVTQDLTRISKIKRWDKRQALRDLAEIGGLKKEDDAPRTVFNIQINL